jgi:protein-disulfide isomerase
VLTVQPKLERTVSVAIGISAMAIAFVSVHREFVASAATPRLRSVPSGIVSSWQDLISAGRLVGAAEAPVTIIEFTDLECPFCRSFNTVLRAVQKKFGTAVAYVFVHTPIHSHRFALSAARAAECAAVSGRFSAMVNAIFERQDSLGLKSWGSYASDAGVADTVSFNRCVRANTPLPLVEAGLAAAKRIDMNGTPTVIVNGWRFAHPPGEEELLRVVGEIVAGRQPFPNGPGAAPSR